MVGAMHGGGGVHDRGACMVGGCIVGACMAGGCVWQGGCGRGHAWQGMCMARGHV